LQIWQNLFSLAVQPAEFAGHVFFCILGHFSQAIPQTPIFIFGTFEYLLCFAGIYQHWVLLESLKAKASYLTLGDCSENHFLAT